ncbi:MAG: substrate-binding domain-containing protein [Syntrophomonadaceae bacterium]|jgi:phosphate transport system substrate-binding protein|nr:substrate-binding domain-containing protein [Syntrophomonadaceae bacterium]
MIKKTCIFILCAFLFSALMACAGGDSGAFNSQTPIKVVSREDGSGTRGAFIELFGIEIKHDNGDKQDTTTKEAIIAKQTDVMITNIINDPYAVGYISLGSLNSTVKAVDIDGVKASAENVKNGTYIAARPFNIVTKGEASGLAADFISFILSAEGQAVIGKNYIPVSDNAPVYLSGLLSSQSPAGSEPGRIVVAGSSSVSPVMEQLKEAYVKIKPDAIIEIQQSDSAAGIMSATNGTCDIGMVSRDLKASEAEQLNKAIQIASDGIVVIINNANPITNFTKEQVKAIFTGQTTRWSDAE